MIIIDSAITDTLKDNHLIKQHNICLTEEYIIPLKSTRIINLIQSGFVSVLQNQINQLLLKVQF